MFLNAAPSTLLSFKFLLYAFRINIGLWINKNKIMFIFNTVFTGDFFEEWNEITPQTYIRKFEEHAA
jgi:hypothetical protein